MANFINDITLLTGLPFDVAFGSFRYVMFGSHACYIEQHKGISGFDTAEVTVLVKGGKLFVRGEDLRIKHMTGGELVICGFISSVEHAVAAPKKKSVSDRRQKKEERSDNKNAAEKTQAGRSLAKGERLQTVPEKTKSEVKA